MARDRRQALTQRQHEILTHVRRGFTNKEIAEELGISEDGVKAHLSRLFLRFSVTNRVELLAAADGELRREGIAQMRADRSSAPTDALGELRAIAGRAGVAGRALGASTDTAIASKLAVVRDALAAVDGALAIVNDLPPETTGAVVVAVRKRLAEAFDAIDSVRAEGSAAQTA